MQNGTDQTTKAARVESIGLEVNLLHASRFGARVRAILLGWGGLEIAALGAAAFAQGFLVVNVLAVAFTNFAFFHEL